MTSVPRDFRASRAVNPPVSAQMVLRLCLDCPHRGGACLPGLRLMQKLAQAVGAARMGPEFEMSGNLRSDACGRDCQLAWRVAESGAWVFGDVAEGCDLEAMMAHAAGQEGALRPGQVPGAAAVLVTRAGRLS
ncbi:hypothetical protein [Gemmobacter caeruleus]|uniref:hypothetical protein n=1 Tax=Gemmobacter caeruleus TaxID=2595004 RepID=UPI0011EEC22A|nr:hypothetical protein [Gemmobacter caeruleus]